MFLSVFGKFNGFKRASLKKNSIHADEASWSEQIGGTKREASFQF